MRRHFAAAALAVGLFAGQGVARAGADPRFAPVIAVPVDGKPVRLVLTGTALRSKYWLSVYTVGSYVKEGAPVRDAETLARLDAPKQLRLIFERDVDGVTMAKSFRESIGWTYPAPAFAAELKVLERYFHANPVRQGDHIVLTYLPGVGLSVEMSGRPGTVVKSVPFARAAWDPYLGRANLGAAIRTGLTSRLR